MKKTKNVLAAALIAALLIPSLQSCKKGEGDPFISLKSRKARVAGEWTFSKLKDESRDTDTDSDGEITTNNTIIEIEGSVGRVSVSSDSQYGTSQANGTGAAVATANFEKDGAFTIKYTLSGVNMNYDGDVVVMSMTQEMTGTWNFLGGVEEDYKKKERIVLNTTKQVMTTSYSYDGAVQTEVITDTYANGEQSEVWHLTTLKNKEMVIEGKRNGVSSYKYNYDDGIFTDEQVGTSSSTGGLTATLTQD